MNEKRLLIGEAVGSLVSAPTLALLCGVATATRRPSNTADDTFRFGVSAGDSRYDRSVTYPDTP